MKWLAILLAFLLPTVCVRAGDTFDVVVYGGTSAGVMAAVASGRAGKSVALIETGGHVGGMTSAGLGESDVGNVDTIGGLAREFYERVYKYYKQPDAWRLETRGQFLARRKGGLNEKQAIQWVFEPHVAEQLFQQMLADAHVNVILHQRLDLNNGVQREDNKIVCFRTEQGRTFHAKAFIDCTYEGDLMAKAGVQYIVGRESNSVYGETLNGVRANVSKPYTASPFVTPGDPASGTLPFVEPHPPAAEGTGDGRTQAYNFRLCLTDDPTNQILVTRPATYDPRLYELVARFIAENPNVLPGANLFKLSGMPNLKTDSNNQGSFSTDFVGASYAWPEADYTTREKIWQQHKDYTLGFLWFLAHDPRLPEGLRKEVARWGLAKDEFTDTDGFPFQLYVREARRMIGEYVETEQDAMAKRHIDDGIAFASYLLDSHWIARFADSENRLRSEGVYYNKMPAPMPISYRALVPKRDQCTNLLVPVCLSASHVAYGTIRMEPVYMMLGQAAALAADISIDSKAAVQDVSYDQLHERLIEAKQVIALPK